MSQNSPDGVHLGSRGRLGAAAVIAVLIGALGSLGFMLRVGRRNESRLLIALFALWVLSPFLALLWATIRSRRWSALTRATLHTVTLVLTLGSLGLYGAVALGPPRPKPAFVFLVVPPVSWLLLVVAVSGAARIARRRSRPPDPA